MAESPRGEDVGSGDAASPASDGTRWVDVLMAELDSSPPLALGGVVETTSVSPSALSIESTDASVDFLDVLAELELFSTSVASSKFSLGNAAVDDGTEGCSARSTMECSCEYSNNQSQAGSGDHVQEFDEEWYMFKVEDPSEGEVVIWVRVSQCTAGTNLPPRAVKSEARRLSRSRKVLDTVASALSSKATLLRTTARRAMVAGVPQVAGDTRATALGTPAEAGIKLESQTGEDHEDAARVRCSAILRVIRKILAEKAGRTKVIVKEVWHGVCKTKQCAMRASRRGVSEFRHVVRVFISKGSKSDFAHSPRGSTSSRARVGEKVEGCVESSEDEDPFRMILHSPTTYLEVQSASQGRSTLASSTALQDHVGRFGRLAKRTQKVSLGLIHQANQVRKAVSATCSTRAGSEANLDDVDDIFSIGSDSFSDSDFDSDGSACDPEA